VDLRDGKRKLWKCRQVEISVITSITYLSVNMSESLLLLHTSYIIMEFQVTINNVSVQFTDNFIDHTLYI
jgi:hypothetical protein